MVLGSAQLVGLVGLLVRLYPYWKSMARGSGCIENRAPVQRPELPQPHRSDRRIKERHFQRPFAVMAGDEPVRHVGAGAGTEHYVRSRRYCITLIRLAPIISAIAEQRDVVSCHRESVGPRGVGCQLPPETRNIDRRNVARRG